MSAYDTAWLVIGGAALVGTLGLVMLTRRLRPGALRNVLRWLPPLLLLVPAAVPGHPGNYAPAFVVLAFEWLFQAQGEPAVALRVLLIAAALGLTGILVMQRLLGRAQEGAEAADPPREAQS